MGLVVGVLSSKQREVVVSAEEEDHVALGSGQWRQQEEWGCGTALPAAPFCVS